MWTSNINTMKNDQLPNTNTVCIPETIFFISMQSKLAINKQMRAYFDLDVE